MPGISPCKSDKFTRTRNSSVIQKFNRVPIIRKKADALAFFSDDLHL